MALKAGLEQPSLLVPVGALASKQPVTKSDLRPFDEYAPTIVLLIVLKNILYVVWMEEDVAWPGTELEADDIAKLLGVEIELEDAVSHIRQQPKGSIVVWARSDWSSWSSWSSPVTDIGGRLLS